MLEGYEYGPTRFVGARELLNLVLGGLQLAVTLTEQCHAAFVFREGIVERGRAVLECLENAVEFDEGGFESRFGHEFQFRSFESL